MELNRVTEGILHVLATKSDSGIIHKALNYHESCSALAKHDFGLKDVVVMQFQQVQIIFQSGDIVDLIYIIMEHSVLALQPRDQN
jgi:hypothetical protein